MSIKNGYGVHHTIYEDCSDETLYAMYRGERWFSLCEIERQQLLQETVNRAALRNGELGACEVKFENLDGSTLGQQSGNTIAVNRTIFAQDKYVHNYNGHIIEEPIKDSNWLALETVLHEDIHAWQNQCVQGIASCQNKELLKEYMANDFTVSFVQDGNGMMQLGSHYLNGLNKYVGYELYYFQATERDAHYYAEKQTLQMIEHLQTKYGTEESCLEYQNRVLQSGYNAVFERAQAKFGTHNFEKEINQVLVNTYYGTNIPVEANMQIIVQKEMAESYLEQTKNAMCHKEEAHKNDTCISIEDYDKNMRETTTAYYDFVNNEPTVWNEEGNHQTLEAQELYEFGESNSMQDTNAFEFEIEIENNGIGEDCGGIE